MRETRDLQRRTRLVRQCPVLITPLQILNAQ
jgi:hypothetical protein